MLKNLFFDAFFAIFVIALFVSSVFSARPALSSTGAATIRTTTRQAWFTQPVYDYSRNLWGQMENAFSHEEPKKGVLIGSGGWLAGNSGFPCPAATAQTLGGHLDYIVATRNLLAERNTTLLVVLIPPPGRMQSCQRRIYGKALDYMDRHRVPVVDLRATRNSLQTADGALEIRNGDVVDDILPRTAPPIELADAATLTDASSPGSSLEQSLKQTLRMDLQNVTAGRGPFPSMDRYLRNAAWTANPPDLLVWEIPERYLLVRR